MLGTYHSTNLLEILQEIPSIREPSQLWRLVLEKACKTIQSESATYFEPSSATYFEASEDEQTLKVAACYGVEESRLTQVPFKTGKGVCGWVAKNKKPVVVTDAKEDKRFDSGVDAVTGFHTRSILCVPVVAQQKMYGVLEIMNRKNSSFSPQDLEFVTLLASQTAIAYQNIRLMEENDRLKALLAGKTA